MHVCGMCAFILQFVLGERERQFIHKNLWLFCIACMCGVLEETLQADGHGIITLLI